MIGPCSRCGITTYKKYRQKPLCDRCTTKYKRDREILSDKHIRPLSYYYILFDAFKDRWIAIPIVIGNRWVNIMIVIWKQSDLHKMKQECLRAVRTSF